MATPATSHRTGTSPPPAAAARARGLAAVLAFAFAYLGLLVGAPAPVHSAGPHSAALQAAQGIQHLAARDTARASASAVRLDPRAPAPPPPSADRTALATAPVPDAGTHPFGAPRPWWPRPERARSANFPRAPPSLPA